jgi:hypothetical protein
MPDHLAQELALLPQLGVADLRSRYAQVFGETTRTGNRGQHRGDFGGPNPTPSCSRVVPRLRRAEWFSSVEIAWIVRDSRGN